MKHDVAFDQFKYAVIRVFPSASVQTPVFRSDSYLLACIAGWNYCRKTGLAANVYNFASSRNECRSDQDGFYYYAGNGTYIRFNPFGHMHDLNICA